VPLVVGLGNPGPRYAGTRHNAGWWVVERLAARWGAVAGERRDEYRTWDGRFAGRDVTLLEPLTFMNASGEAVAAWGGTHGLEPGDLLVVADDVYLPTGHLRLRAAGSSGGHRGLADIERAIGTREYARLRFGVGAAVTTERLREHVLEQPVDDEREALERATDMAADAVESWIADGITMAMNRTNKKVPREVPEP